MFDLIDDFSRELWEDKGDPPEDLDKIDGFSVYDIVKREHDKTSKTVKYYLHDQCNQTSKIVQCEGVTASFDPLKNIRHMHAKIQNNSNGGEVHDLIGILTDNDWIERKIII